MRTSIVMVSAAALGLTLIDFLMSTRPLLTEQADLRAQIRAQQKEDVELLSTREPPPSVEQLGKWQSAASRAREVANDGEKNWFAGAEDTADYLIELPEERPGLGDPQDIRERLRTKLIYLNSEVTRITARGADLGIQFPTASHGLLSDPPALRDQVERATLLAWTLGALDEKEGLETLRMERDDDGRLQVELEMRGTASATLRFFESFIADTPEIAPRRIVEFQISPVDQASWGREITEARSPPVTLHLRVSMDSPSLDRGPRDADGEETGP